MNERFKNAFVGVGERVIFAAHGDCHVVSGVLKTVDKPLQKLRGALHHFQPQLIGHYLVQALLMKY